MTDAHLDDDRLRSGLAVVLGGLMLLTPMLAFGQDGATTILVTAIGAVVILPVWRSAGEALKGPIAIIAFLELIIGPLVRNGMAGSALAVAPRREFGTTEHPARAACGVSTRAAQSSPRNADPAR